MFKKIILIEHRVKKFIDLFTKFCDFFFYYLKKKTLISSRYFEKNKNILVKFFLMRRGRYNRPFLHLSAIGFLSLGVLIAPFLADTFPVFSSSASQQGDWTLTSNKEQSINVDNNVFQTDISQKPRDKVIIYTVEKGDTLSTIAKKFNISVDTIKWANDMENDNMTVGDELKILPVTGIYYKVEKGDTVYTIAKKFDTNPQQIVDFPFNDFANPETFSLVEGQMLIVPDGVKPSERPVARQTYIVQGPVSGAGAAGGLTWPIRGLITQYASWYHMALDIADPVGTPIYAAQNGKVTYVSVGSWDYGYGTNVWVESGDGIGTHYNHMSGVNVSIGQQVTAGQTVIGWVGMTGRTTGPHLHFELKRNGVLVNPLSYIQ